MDTIPISPNELTPMFLSPYERGGYAMISRNRQDFATVSNLHIEKGFGLRILSWEMLDLCALGAPIPPVPWSRSKAPISYGLMAAFQRFTYTQSDRCLTINSRFGGDSVIKLFPTDNRDAWIDLLRRTELDRAIS